MAKDAFGFRGEWLIYVTHHSAVCPVVKHPELGSRTSWERGACRCGAFEGSYSRDLIKARNLVTTAGAVFYMQQITNGAFTNTSPTVATVTNDFSTLELANDAAGNPAPAITNNRGSMSTIIASSQAEATSGYPRVDDTGDADNTGDGPDVLTWTFNYTAAAFNATDISDAWITTKGALASEAIACHFDEATFDPTGVFDKAATDTLKMIYNLTGAGA